MANLCKLPYAYWIKYLTFNTAYLIRTEIMNKIICLLLILPALLWSQTNNGINVVIRHYYRDKVVSVENWKGTDNITDSLKTYYSNGQLKEVFYFDDKGYKNFKGLSV